MSREQIGSQLKGFILERFPLAQKKGITEETPLLQSGIVDSLGILELVGFMEKEFMLHISDDELTPSNFENLGRLVSFVASKAAAAQPEKAESKAIGAVR